MKLESYGVLLAVTFCLYKEIARRDELIKELADFQLSIKGLQGWRSHLLLDPRVGNK